MRKGGNLNSSFLLPPFLISPFSSIPLALSTRNSSSDW